MPGQNLYKVKVFKKSVKVLAVLKSKEKLSPLSGKLLLLR